MIFPTSSSPTSSSHPQQSAAPPASNQRAYQKTASMLRDGNPPKLDLDGVTDAFNHLRFQHLANTTAPSQSERPPKRALTNDESSSKFAKS